MNSPRFQVVDGAEAIATAVYRLNDFIWIDPDLPGEQFRETFAAWIKSKKRNLHDRVPQIVPDMASEQTTAFLVSPRTLPRMLGLLKERPATVPAVVHIAGNKISLEENAAPKIFLSGSIQEASDFGLLAQLEARARPQTILHLFDGSRLAGELEKIDTLSDASLGDLSGKSPSDFHQLLKYFTEVTGRNVAPIDYAGHPEAEKIFVAMGPVCADLMSLLPAPSEGQRIGLLKVRFLAPFDSKDFVQKIPGTVQTIYALEHPTLYLKVLNALHEGMVNRWSWFATLPRLVKFKSAEGALATAGVTSPASVEGLSVRWEGLPADGSLELVRHLVSMLSEYYHIQACLLPVDAAQADLQIRLSRTPFPNQEIVASPDLLIRRQSGSNTSQEIQEATLATTALLKQILEQAPQKDLPLDENACRQRWREIIEDHFRPLGAVFARANARAVDTIWNVDPAGSQEAPATLKLADRPSIKPPLDLASQRLHLLSQPLEAISDGFGGIVLPLLRESDLQKGILEFYRARVRRLSFQAARATFTDRAFGLAAVLDDIQDLRSRVNQPLIARLSALSPDSWAAMGADLQEAGVKAVEAVFANGAPPAQRLTALKRLKEALRIPVFVAFTLFEGISEETLRELEQGGADGFVFFQEWPQKDYDLRGKSWVEVTPPPGIQHRLEVLMALERFRSRTHLPIIANGGFSTDDDIQKALALGAQWVQVG